MGDDTGDYSVNVDAFRSELSDSQRERFDQHLSYLRQQREARSTVEIGVNMILLVFEAAAVVRAAIMTARSLRTIAAAREAVELTDDAARLADDAAGASSQVSRLPVPPTPEGTSLREFGRIMNWGSGHEAARAQIPNLTREGLQQAGVTREMAQSWARFYQNEALRVPQNPSAAGRAELMEAAASLLE